MFPSPASIEVSLAAIPQAWPVIVSPAAGVIVGLSLGLTGGGGAIFAVPLLVYGVGVDPPAAVTISLVTVAVTALVGTVVGRCLARYSTKRWSASQTKAWAPTAGVWSRKPLHGR